MGASGCELGRAYATVAPKPSPTSSPAVHRRQLAQRSYRYLITQKLHFFSLPPSILLRPKVGSILYQLHLVSQDEVFPAQIYHLCAELSYPRPSATYNRSWHPPQGKLGWSPLSSKLSCILGRTSVPVPLAELWVSPSVWNVAISSYLRCLNLSLVLEHLC